MKKNHKKPFHYTQCGLDYIYLLNGFEITPISEDEYYYSIEDAINLHKTIANQIITGKDRLRGQEMRFLRTLMGCSQEDLATVFGVTRVTINRTENAKAEMPLDKTWDFTLRHWYASSCDGTRFAERINQMLNEKDEEDTPNRKLSFEDTPHGWQEARAA